jgi:EmrB/QacA subfamily drug resistance transporter
MATETTPVPAAVWRLAAIVAFGAVMAGLDTSVANVGLEVMGRDLGVSLAQVQWTTSAFLLALAAVLPACGWLGRRYGPGRVWLWALLGFTIASGLCALAPTVELLIVFRVLQGIAGGLLVPTGMTIVSQAAGPARMGRVLSVSAVPAIVAPAVGPVVGSLLLANLSWHWLFLINLPIGVVGLVLGMRTLPRGDGSPGDRIDLLGLVLAATGLALLIYGITGVAERNELGLPALGVGVVALALFAVRSLRRPDPLLDLRLVRNPIFGAAVAQMVFNGAALFGGMVVMPLYFQLMRGADIVSTGLLLVAFSLGAAAMFPVAGRLTDRYGGGAVATVGMLITVATTVPFALMPADVPLVWVEVLQVLRGIGLALSGTPAASAALASVERRQLPDANAGLNIVMRVGGASGGAIFVVILTDALASGVGPTAAFHGTFWALTAAAVAALGGAVWLLVEQRRRARPVPVPAVEIVAATADRRD